MPPTGCSARRPPRASSTTVGTLVYQHGGRIETSRLYHLRDAHGEYEKLVNLDGPAREVIRNNEQVRCYYPDAKVDPRRAAQHRATRSRRCCRSSWRRWPSTITSARPRSRASPGSRRRPMCSSRRTGCATATSSGPTSRPACCSRRALLNERNEAGRAVRLQRHPDRRQARSRHGQAAVRDRRRRTGRCANRAAGDVAPQETGWVVKRAAAGIHQDRRRLSHAARQAGAGRAHLVYSDGLVAVSVFVEPMPATPQPVGLSQQGGDQCLQPAARTIIW